MSKEMSKQGCISGEIVIEVAGEMLPEIREALRRKGLDGDYDHHVMLVIKTMAISLGICSQHLPVS